MNKIIARFTSSLMVIVILFSIIGTVDAQKKLKTPKKISYDFEEGQLYLIKMRNESTIICTYQGPKGDLHSFKSDVSRLEISLQDIESVKPLSDDRIKNGKYWFTNPHSTRYLFGPSAFNLKKNEGYMQSIYGVFNSVNVGLSDHFSIGAGTELLSLIAGSPVLVLTPKFGGYKVSENWHVGTGAMGFVIVEEDIFSGGIVYVVGTRGNEDHNFTIGAGVATTTNSYDDDLYNGSLPIMTVSGMTRLSKNIGLVTENWILFNDDVTPIFSYGVRFFGEKISVDLALINNKSISDEFTSIGIPFIDFVYKF
jgi:hypothetical protein